MKVSGGRARRRAGEYGGKLGGLKRIRKHILVCDDKDCAKRGGREALKELKGALKEAGLRDEALISRVGCFDQCGHAPVLVVYPEGVWYGGVDGRSAREIAARHVAGVGPAPRCEVLRDMRADEKGRG